MLWSPWGCWDKNPSPLLKRLLVSEPSLQLLRIFKRQTFFYKSVCVFMCVCAYEHLANKEARRGPHIHERVTSIWEMSGLLHGCCDLNSGHNCTISTGHHCAISLALFFRFLLSVDQRKCFLKSGPPCTTQVCFLVREFPHMGSSGTH